MDSTAQIDIGLSKSFWIIHYKLVIYKQKKCSHPKIFKNRSPDHMLGWFLHHSNSKNLAQTARTQIFPKNVKIECRLKKSTICIQRSQSFPPSPFAPPWYKTVWYGAPLESTKIACSLTGSDLAQISIWNIRSGRFYVLFSRTFNVIVTWGKRLASPPFV